jgi:hypothetical protein
MSKFISYKNRNLPTNLKIHIAVSKRERERETAGCALIFSYTFLNVFFLQPTQNPNGIYPMLYVKIIVILQTCLFFFIVQKPHLPLSFAFSFQLPVLV